MGVSNMTLVKIGAIGGIITVSMGMALRHKINENIRKTEYYKDALKSVRTNRGAVHLLGEPIREGKIEVSDRERNFTNHDTAQYEVPVKGPKQKGTIYFWANKTNNEWIVSRIELALENEPNRRLLVKDVEKKIKTSNLH